MEKLENLWKIHRNFVVGIGECGLDYSNPDLSENQKSIQKTVFENQLKLAIKCMFFLLNFLRIFYFIIFYFYYYYYYYYYTYIIYLLFYLLLFLIF